MSASRRFLAPAVLVVAALAAVQGRTKTWGGADAPDGTRYKVSPVGISHVLEPGQTVSSTVNCRWGEPRPPCVVAEAAAFRRLGLVAPIVLLGASLALGGALLAAAGRWASPWLTPSCGAAAVLCFGAAPWLLVTSAQRGLAVLTPLSVGVGGTLGVLQLSIAAALVAGVAAARLRRLDGRGPGGALAVLALATVPAAMFFAMFPFPHALGFLVPALGLGFIAGRD